MSGTGTQRAEALGINKSGAITITPNSALDRHVRGALSPMWVHMAASLRHHATVTVNDEIIERERRQLQLMLDRLRRFQAGDLSVSHAITDLEALLYQLELVDESWRREFTEAWSDLEIPYAVALDRQTEILTAAGWSAASEAEEHHDGASEPDHVLVGEASDVFTKLGAWHGCDLVDHQAACLPQAVVVVGIHQEPD